MHLTLRGIHIVATPRIATDSDAFRLSDLVLDADHSRQAYQSLIRRDQSKCLHLTSSSSMLSNGSLCGSFDVRYRCGMPDRDVQNAKTSLDNAFLKFLQRMRQFNFYIDALLAISQMLAALTNARAPRRAVMPSVSHQARTTSNVQITTCVSIKSLTAQGSFFENPSTTSTATVCRSHD